MNSLADFACLKDIWPSFRENRARLDVSCRLTFLSLVVDEWKKKGRRDMVRWNQYLPRGWQSTVRLNWHYATSAKWWQLSTLGTVCRVCRCFYFPFFFSFWAAAPKGTKSCRTQGESVRLYVRTSVRPPCRILRASSPSGPILTPILPNSPNPCNMAQI